MCTSRGHHAQVYDEVDESFQISHNVLSIVVCSQLTDQQTHNKEVGEVDSKCALQGGSSGSQLGSVMTRVGGGTLDWEHPGNSCSADHLMDVDVSRIMLTSQRHPHAHVDLAHTTNQPCCPHVCFWLSFPSVVSPSITLTMTGASHLTLMEGGGVRFDTTKLTIYYRAL